MHALAMLALLLDGPVPAAPPATTTPAATARPASTELPQAAAGDAGVPSDAAEAIESALVPSPLGRAAILSIAADLGVPDGEREAVDTIEQRYRGDTGAEHEKAVTAVRRRIAASTRPGAPGAAPAPVECPERIAMLEAGGRWRDILAAADNALLARLASLRTEAATACAGLVAYRRAEARDAAPSDDPLAALSLSSLIDAAGLDAVDRRRVEDALDRQWHAVARAIEDRRRRLGAAELERARLLESWGPAWRVGAPPAELAARLTRLAEAEARFAAADEPLRKANRGAAMALVKMLGTAASDRVRDAADRALWPWIFSTDARLADAARRAGDAGGEELAGHLRAQLRELDARLKATRRDLGRRASDAEAAAELDDERPGHDHAVARLDAAARLLEARAKRMRAVADTCARMASIAASDERARPIMAELLASVEAEQRALAWELEGTRARIDALGAAATDTTEPGQATGDAGTAAP